MSRGNPKKQPEAASFHQRLRASEGKLLRPPIAPANLHLQYATQKQEGKGE